MSDEELVATAHAYYYWDCPACYVENDEGDIEPHGLTECQDCGSTVYLS